MQNTALFLSWKKIPLKALSTMVINITYIRKDSHSKLSLVFTTRKNFISSEDLIRFLLSGDDNYMTHSASLFGLTTSKLRAIFNGPLQQQHNEDG